MEENTYIDVKAISDTDEFEFECKMFDLLNLGYETKYIDFKASADAMRGIWVAAMTKKCIDED